MQSLPGASTYGLADRMLEKLLSTLLRQPSPPLSVPWCARHVKRGAAQVFWSERRQASFPTVLSAAQRPAETSKAESNPTSANRWVDGILGVQQSDPTTEFDKSHIIFLGSGTSEGVPRVSCLTSNLRKCPVCWAAVQPGDRNRRRNTSLMVRYVAADGNKFNILVDAGKFFYHSALQWFPYYGIRNLDSVIITHSHADAVGGLDDLRDWTNNVQRCIPIYVTQRDVEVLAKTHYYLVNPSVITAGTAVSKLQFKLIDEKPFQVHGLEVIPLPVWHGPGYRSLGFRIGDMCYISDVSEIPEDTYPLLENCDLLVLDALKPDKSSVSHFGLPQALEEVRKIRPNRTLLTGMMHTMDHDSVNKQLLELLVEEGIDVQLSYDGLRVDLPLKEKIA